MATVEEQGIEYHRVETCGTRDVEVLNHKDSLRVISEMRQQLILKCWKRYAVIDGAATAYIYEEK